MKRFLSAIFIFLLVITICLIETIYIKKTFANAKSTVQTLKTKCLNGEFLENNEFEILKETWNNKGKYLAIFINREQLSNLTDKIYLLNAAYNEDTAEFILLAEEITIILEEIEKIESINTFGIL